MWLLDWLLDRWSKIYELFETLWASIEELGKTGLSWIKANAYNLYVTAVNYAVGLFNDMQTRLNNARDTLNANILYWRDWLKALLDSGIASLKQLITDARNLAYTLLQQAKDFAQGLINNLSGWVNQAIADVRAFAQSLVNNASSFLQGLITNARTFAQGLVDQAISFLQGLIATIQAGLDTFRAQWEGALLTFFSNPALFIFAIVEAWAYDWLTYWLGMILGSVNATLPPRPSLFGGNGGGGGGGGTIPPGSGTLIYPSDYHSISGYVFGPNHPGIDFGTPCGVPIWACDSGAVTNVVYGLTGYGHYVDIDHGNGWMTRYAHLAEIYVSISQPVSQKQVIAAADTTGNSTGCHLHFEARYNGTPVDPLTVLH
jgi:hypothetical protein